jgi:pyocin large subunit-like protein
MRLMPRCNRPSSSTAAAQSLCQSSEKGRKVVELNEKIAARTKRAALDGGAVIHTP